VKNAGESVEKAGAKAVRENVEGERRCREADVRTAEERRRFKRVSVLH